MSNSTTHFVIDGKTIMRESMPRAYRLLDVQSVAIDDGFVCCTATLYHRHLSPRVAWTCRTIDPRLKKRALVSIRWDRQPVCENGEMHIGRLEPVETPDESINLFDTVPPPVVIDPALLERARVLFNQLPRHFKRIFNAIFRESLRFLWFVAGPASLHGQYAQMNGNLLRSVEIAESALRIAGRHRAVFPALIILGALLRDAGKADCYRFDPMHNCFVVTDDGQLVGHRLAAVDWLTVAITRFGIEIPKPHYNALIHILSAVSDAPAWLGLPETHSLEAPIIAMAERWVEHDADWIKAARADTDGNRSTDSASEATMGARHD